jgi:diguanylate cyclase (GGDEF)-like protein
MLFPMPASSGVEEVAEPPAAPPAARIALLPVFHIPDRAPIAYEVLPRPADTAPGPGLYARALELALYTTPAVLLASLSDAPPDAITSVALAREYGVQPSEVAWVAPAGWRQERSTAQFLAEARTLGFQVALEAVGWAEAAHADVVELRPDFLIIGEATVATITDGVAAGAELAGLLSFAARLDVRCIARGVSERSIANALTAYGLQYGSGAFLSAPLVLSTECAASGDVVAGPSWFRQHQSRKLDVLGQGAQKATQVLALPESQPQSGEGMEDFATVLAEAARRLQAEHDPNRILRILGDLLPRVLPLNALAVFEADWDNDLLIPRIMAGNDIVSLRDDPFPMSRGITGWAFARGLPYNCVNTATHPAAGTVPGTEEDQNSESLLVIPLIAGDNRIGVLDVWRDGEAAFDSRDLEHCALFAHVTAAAWHNAQLYREVETRARTDALTGLHNTRWLDEVAPQEAARALRSGAQIGVLLLDLDHFKLVNDTGGHAAGDRTLRSVARVLHSVVRTGDDVVRFGGEEFLVLLHESGAEGALRVAEEVRAALAEMPPPVSGVRVTASVGVAVFPQHGPTLDDAVRAADLAMYRAKAGGRDRVIPAEGLLATSA